MTFEIYFATYCENKSCSCHPEWDERTNIVVANSLSEAKGFILENNPNTRIGEWTIYKIDQTKVGAYSGDTLEIARELINE